MKMLEKFSQRNEQTGGWTDATENITCLAKVIKTCCSEPRCKLNAAMAVGSGHSHETL